jgi:hypothetical protein
VLAKVILGSGAEEPTAALSLLLKIVVKVVYGLRALWTKRYMVCRQ